LLANAFESITGAIYLDQGYDVAKKFILENVIVELDEVFKNKSYMDPKSYFQEKAQELEKVTPSYKLIKEWGPDHDKHFVVGVFLDDKKVAEGEGRSKQEAQREQTRAEERQKRAAKALPETLAMLLHDYSEALAPDFGLRPGTSPDWEGLAAGERSRMVAATRLALLDLRASPSHRDPSDMPFPGLGGGSEGKECGC